MPVTKSPLGSPPCRSCATRITIIRRRRATAIKKFWRRDMSTGLRSSAGGETIAVHPRSYETADFVYNPLHYLALLEQKTKALDQAAPLDNWRLADCVHRLRRLMEARMGTAGRREFIQRADAAGGG